VDSGRLHLHAEVRQPAMEGFGKQAGDVIQPQFEAGILRSAATQRNLPGESREIFFSPFFKDPITRPRILHRQGNTSPGQDIGGRWKLVVDIQLGDSPTPEPPKKEYRQTDR